MNLKEQDAAIASGMEQQHLMRSPADGGTELKVYKEALWIQDYWAQSLALLGTVGAALGGSWLGITGQEESRWYFSIPALILFLSLLGTMIGTIASLRQTDRLSTVTRERDALRREKDSAVEQAQQQIFEMGRDYFELLDEQLAILANHSLYLGDTERISVYRHSGDKFVLLCRYSKNPKYLAKGRPWYPDDQGCIRDAWLSGESYIPCLPDPVEESHAYSRKLRIEWNIPEEVSQRFGMKSRRYAALAIENHREQRVGVIVVESTRTDVLEWDRVQEVVKSTEEKRFAKFIERARTFDASNSYAKEKGF